MSNLPLQKKLFVAALAAMPIIFLLSIWRSVDLLRASSSSLLVYCIQKLEMLISYFSHTENILLIALAGMLVYGFVKGVVFFVNQLYKTNKLKREFQSKLVKECPKQIAGIKVSIVEDGRFFALTVGFLKPIIYVSKSLADNLEMSELKSVIFHEGYHQNNHHPLAKLIIGTVKSFLFFVPVMSELTKQLTLRQEAMADKRAIEKTSRKFLVSAFLKINQSMAYVKKVPPVVSQFSLTKDRLILVVERTKAPSLRFPITISILSLFIVSSLAVFLTWPYAPHAHARINEPINLIESQANFCHGLNQSILLAATGDQSKINMTPKME